MKNLTSIIIASLIFTPGEAQIIIQKDPDIEKMVNDVNADSLKSYINKSVSFWNAAYIKYNNRCKKRDRRRTRMDNF